MTRLISTLVLCLATAPALATPEPGRLFYTPMQRAQLEQMRAGRHQRKRGRDHGEELYGFADHRAIAPVAGLNVVD